MEGLAPGTEYELRAYAINAFGSSLPSESRELVSNSNRCLSQIDGTKHECRKCVSSTPSAPPCPAPYLSQTTYDPDYLLQTRTQLGCKVSVGRGHPFLHGFTSAASSSSHNTRTHQCLTSHAGLPLQWWR